MLILLSCLDVKFSYFQVLFFCRKCLSVSPFILVDCWFLVNFIYDKRKCSKLENCSEEMRSLVHFCFLLYSRLENRHFKVIINILQNQIICWHIDGQLYNKIGWCDLIICPDKKLSKCLSPSLYKTYQFHKNHDLTQQSIFFFFFFFIFFSF